MKDGKLEYFCNTFVTYSVRGIHTALNVIWDWEAPGGAGDTHFAVYRGGLSRVEVRQTKADKYRPEVYIVPNDAADKAEVLAAARGEDRVAAGHLCRASPSKIAARKLRLTIPDTFRVGHEAHFAQVTSNFLGYIRTPGQHPRVGAPEHAREILRDDDGHGVEPAGRAAARSASGASVRQLAMHNARCTMETRRR